MIPIWKIFHKTAKNHQKKSKILNINNIINANEKNLFL